MSSTTQLASASTMDRLSLYMGTCCRVWIGLYLALCCLTSVTSMMLHVAAVGLLLCILSYFRLPAPEPGEVFRILGRDPLNFDGSPSRNMSRGVLGLIAHRAAPLDAPENSIAAVKKAKKAGAKSIHFDMSFTADGVAVALRPTNLQDIQKDALKNKTSEMTLDIAQNLDVASLHPLKDEFSPAHPVKVEEMVDFCLNEELKIFLEIPLPDNLSLELVSDYVVNELYAKKLGLYSKAVVISAWPHVIFAIRQKDPRIVCGLIWSPKLLQLTFPRSFSLPLYYLSCLGDRILGWAIHDFLWYFLGLAVMVVDKDQINAPYMQKWRSKGIRVITSPVNKSLERLYFEKQLKITCMADTMDEIGIDKLLEDN